MTEKKTWKERLRAKTKSLRIRFLILILIGSALAAGIYILMQSSVHLYVENVYESEEKRIERELRYVEDLQHFITQNGVTYDSVDAISRWMEDNRFVYLLIYKDDEIIFQPGEDEDKTEEGGTADNTGDGSGENTGDGSGENTGDGTGENTGDGSGENTGDGTGENTEGNGENGEGGSQNSGKEEEDESHTPKPGPGGITITYPTKAELYEYALAGESYPLILQDGGALSCSLAEYTEYFYYDMSNIVSFALAILALAAIMIVYFYRITTRIARLAKDVSTVSAGAMTHTIRAGKNNDEISILCRNVEQMRSSIVETLQKERAAVNANAELITSMSHDIRTPLTVLLGYLDIMGMQADDEVLMQYITSAKQTANRLKTLSDEMFQYFLVFSDEQTPIPCESYDAKTLLSQFFFEHMLLLGESGYKIVPHVEEGFLSESPALYTNAPGCMRIIDNVFSNLSKYADKKKAIDLYFSEDAERIFIRIVNAVREDKESVESTGIGLKTCERIARNTGVLFEKQDGGESFCVTIGIPKDKGKEK